MGILGSLARSPARVRPGSILRGALWLAAIMLLSFPSRGAAAPSSSEDVLKAAFIYSFSKFVEWPDQALNAKKEFCIATLGRTTLDRDLETLSGKTVHDRTVVFRKLNTPAEAAQCQVLFIGSSELVRIETILEALKDLPVLTIADSDDFCRKGGMLSLGRENARIVFDLNFREMQRGKLKPNPQLLKLARKIYGRP